MKKLIATFLCIVMCLCVFPQNIWAAPSDSGGSPIKILLVGNSYTKTNHFAEILENICTASGRNVSVTSVAQNGRDLNQFADVYNEDGAKLSRILARSKWDYVILQDRHYYPLIYPNKVLTGVRSLMPSIKASGAKLVLNMTWAPAREHRDYIRYASLVKNRRQYQQKVASTYESIGKETGAIVVPTGLAFYRLQRQEKCPSLIRSDYSHPTFAGSYLMACTIYTRLFNATPSSSYHGELRSATARQLVKAAVSTVTLYKKKGLSHVGLL